jgi:hypothetical protein
MVPISGFVLRAGPKRPQNGSVFYPMTQTNAKVVVDETESAEHLVLPHRHRDYPQEYFIPHVQLAISPLFTEFIIAGLHQKNPNPFISRADPTPDVRSSHDEPGFPGFVFFKPDSYGSDTFDMETFTNQLTTVSGDGEDAGEGQEGAKLGYHRYPRKFFLGITFALKILFSTLMPCEAFYIIAPTFPVLAPSSAPYCFFSWCSLQVGLVMSSLVSYLYAWLFSSALWLFGHAAKCLFSPQDRKILCCKQASLCKFSSVHCLRWLLLLMAIPACDALLLSDDSQSNATKHASLRSSMGTPDAEPGALQFGNHSASQYSCRGVLRPTFIVGLPACFVFACSLIFLQLKLTKDKYKTFASKGCIMVFWWFALCLVVFFFVFLGFTIACVKTHKDTGIDEDFYIAAYVVVLLLLVGLYAMTKNETLDFEEENKTSFPGVYRPAQAGVSAFLVCTGLFVLVMVLRSDHGVRLDQHTKAPIPYIFYVLYLSGVWGIGWALWRRHCKKNAEAIRIKGNECGESIPCNVTGLMQAFALMFHTYSFAGFSFAPSIPWTTAPLSINLAPLFTPVTQWYSNYVSDHCSRQRPC